MDFVCLFVLGTASAEKPGEASVQGNMSGRSYLKESEDSFFLLCVYAVWIFTGVQTQHRCRPWVLCFFHLDYKNKKFK